MTTSDPGGAMQFTIDDLPIAAALVDPASQIMASNAAWQSQFTPLSRAVSGPPRLIDLVHPDDRASVTTLLAGTAASSAGGRLNGPDGWSHCNLQIAAPAPVRLLIAVPDSPAEVESELRHRIEVIEAQRNAIADLSAPVLEVWKGVLAVPIIGVIDTARASTIMERILDAVTRKSARTMVLDLTGVDTVDTSTANHLLRMARAVKLLGGRCLISGISPSIARTITHLGIEIRDFATYSTLQEALRSVMGDQMNNGTRKH